MVTQKAPALFRAADTGKQAGRAFCPDSPAPATPPPPKERRGASLNHSSIHRAKGKIRHSLPTSPTSVASPSSCDGGGSLRASGSSTVSVGSVPGGWAIPAPKRNPSYYMGKTGRASSVSEKSSAAGGAGAKDEFEGIARSQSSYAPGAVKTESLGASAYGDAGERYKAMRKSVGDFTTLGSASSFSSSTSVHKSLSCSRSPSAGPQNRALLVGINYSRTRGARSLTGCINDTKLVHKLLSEKFSFEDDAIWVMTDEQIDFGKSLRHFSATKRNIMNGMRWLVHGASPGDTLFFHFSGHGSQVRDLNGDELDGWDEVILPGDYPTAGHILDDDIHKIMVRGLCKGARLTVLVDACSSGTIMDLPYVHGALGGELGIALGVSEEKIRANAMKASEQHSKHRRAKMLLKPIMDHKWKRRKEDAELVRLADEMQRKAAHEIKNNGMVVSFSGCADYQRSADTHNRATAVSYGAMTHAFASAIHSAKLDSPICTFQWLLDHMAATLKKGGHVQTPQLCSSHELNLASQFRL